MAKKHEDLEEIEEIIDESEIIDDEEFIDDEDIIDNDAEETKTKNKKKTNPTKKKKLGKGAIAGIVAGSVTAVVALVLVVIFLILPALSPATTGKVVDVIDFKTGIMAPSATEGIGGLQDYEVAPTQAVVDSLAYDWMSIMTDSSKSDEYKAAAAMVYTQGNELMSKQFAFFRYQVGTTNLGSNSGTLIYERLRRETTTVKYDTTIKMPINHNFNSIAVNFVQSADIRYIKDGVYNRMNCTTKDMVYNSDTGIAYASNWKKQSDKNWNSNQGVNKTPSGYSDLNKVSVWFGSINDSYTIEKTTVEERSVKVGSVSIETKEGYYVIKFTVDTDYVNSDSRTTDKLDEDNSGSGIKYDYCNIELEVWNSGFAKSMIVDEKWTGKVQMYNGSAEAKSTIKYSYSDRDTQDTSYPDSQVDRINNK